MFRKKQIQNKQFVGCGPVICPKCLARGKLQCYVVNHSRGPYWEVTHTSSTLSKKKISKSEYFIRKSLPRRKSCYLGKLLDQELDELLTRRPWPTSAIQVDEITSSFKRSE